MMKKGFQEKRGVIEQGRTPPETDEKQASEDALEDHLAKRAADAVAGQFEQHAIPLAADAGAGQFEQHAIPLAADAGAGQFEQHMVPLAKKAIRQNH